MNFLIAVIATYVCVVGASVFAAWASVDGWIEEERRSGIVRQPNYLGNCMWIVIPAIFGYMAWGSSTGLWLAGKWHLLGSCFVSMPASLLTTYLSNKTIRERYRQGGNGRLSSLPDGIEILPDTPEFLDKLR